MTGSSPRNIVFRLRRAPRSEELSLRSRLYSLLAFISLVLLLPGCASASESVLPKHTVKSVKRVMFGSYTYGGVWTGAEPVLKLEGDLGRRLDIVHWYMNWDNSWDPALLELFRSGARLPLISWQPHDRPVTDIAAGQFDDYIRSWAQGVISYGGPVYLRPFPEMNGDWTSWNGDPASFVLAWRRVTDIFRTEGAHNVRWVWSPNVTDEPRSAGNRMELYYPGGDHVDVLAVDGFNWGDTRPHIGWRSFEEVFLGGYERVAALGDQPVWFAEIASAESGGDKGAWIGNMLTSDAFPRLAALVWFNEDKETDWRVTSSTSALASFHAELPHLGDELAQNDESRSRRD